MPWKTSFSGRSSALRSTTIKNIRINISLNTIIKNGITPIDYLKKAGKESRQVTPRLLDTASLVSGKVSSSLSSTPIMTLLGSQTLKKYFHGTKITLPPEKQDQSWTFVRPWMSIITQRPSPLSPDHFFYHLSSIKVSSSRCCKFGAGRKGCGSGIEGLTSPYDRPPFFSKVICLGQTHLLDLFEFRFFGFQYRWTGVEKIDTSCWIENFPCFEELFIEFASFPAITLIDYLPIQ